MVEKLLIIVDKEKFRYPEGSVPPEEKDVAGKIESILEGYSGAGAGPQGKFFVGANLTIIKLPPETQDEGEPSTPPEVEKTFRTLAPPGSPPEQIAAAMKMAARLGQAKGSK